MFQRHHFDTLPYPIRLQDVYFYENQLQMNINVFYLLDDAGRDLQRLIISRKSYQRVANLFYWKRHYAPITSITRLFSNKTKQDDIKEVLARHTELCKKNHQLRHSLFEVFLLDFVLMKRIYNVFSIILYDSFSICISSRH